MRNWLPFIFLLASCSKPVSENCAGSGLYTKASFPIGTAFNLSDAAEHPLLTQKFSTHFNAFTPENALKFSTISPWPGVYDFSEGDSLVALWQDRARIHGHTLIWHQQLPSWFAQYKGDYKELLQAHVRTVIRHYARNIRSWDVVNEALTEQGELRASPWLEQVGEDYIYLAFKAAQEADAKATLFYNEYNLALNPRKLDAALRLCENLRSRGIRLSGIGMQMHIGVSYPSREEIAFAVEKIWRAGFTVHFSELDISLNPLGNKKNFSEADFQAQAAKYREVVEVYQQIPRDHQFGITLWGIGDADSWIPNYFNRVDAPLLFDAHYNPKPAFCAFQNALK